MVGRKMFCMIDLEGPPNAVSFKVPDEDFEALSQQMYFRPAPYFGRYNWVMIDDMSKMNIREWKSMLKKSYDLVLEKLPAKTRLNLDLQ